MAHHCNCGRLIVQVHGHNQPCECGHHGHSGHGHGHSSHHHKHSGGSKCVPCVIFPGPPGARHVGPSHNMGSLWYDEENKDFYLWDKSACYWKPAPQALSCEKIDGEDWIVSNGCKVIAKKDLAGPKGETGATGLQGEMGVKGDVGATGAVGPAGPKGDPGMDATGTNGILGGVTDNGDGTCTFTFTDGTPPKTIAIGPHSDGGSGVLAGITDNDDGTCTFTFSDGTPPKVVATGPHPGGGGGGIVGGVTANADGTCTFTFTDGTPPKTFATGPHTTGGGGGEPFDPNDLCDVVLNEETQMNAVENYTMLVCRRLGNGAKVLRTLTFTGILNSIKAGLCAELDDVAELRGSKTVICDADGNMGLGPAPGGSGGLASLDCPNGMPLGTNITGVTNAGANSDVPGADASAALLAGLGSSIGPLGSAGTWRIVNSEVSDGNNRSYQIVKIAC